MLNRRKFMKTVTALGMGMVFPSLRPGQVVARPLSCPDKGPIGSVASTDTAAKHPHGECGSLMELDRCADLLDDLDCVEIITNYVGLTEFSRAVGDTSFWRTYCPFCKQRTVRTLEVGHECFNCEWCGSMGSAIDCYAWLEGISHNEARLRLEGLLDDGTLAGRRPEYEHAWELMGRTQSFYHDLLTERPAGADARHVLADQGISTATIKRFMLGYAPVGPTDLLSKHLLAAGYDIQCLHTVCLPAEDGSRTPADVYAGGNLLIPIRDSSGRSWGFFARKLLPAENNRTGGWIQSLVPVSERRRRRLLFPHPSWPEDFHRYHTVLLAETPWDVIVLKNAGIDNVVHMVEGPVSHDPVTRRTLFALSRHVVCPLDSEGKGPRAAYELLDVRHKEGDMVRLMRVPADGGVLGLLANGGTAAVASAMAAAVPLEQWMG
jgi:DNA primase